MSLGTVLILLSDVGFIITNVHKLTGNFSFFVEMLAFSASTISTVPVAVPVKTRGQCKGQIKQTGLGPLGLATQLQPIDRIKPFVHSSRKRSVSVICSAAMNARCSASGQTQTVLKETPTITKAPVRETLEVLPQLFLLLSLKFLELANSILISSINHKENFMTLLLQLGTEISQQPSCTRQ
ncbi:hypothetical protein SADUNF_Sadunf11G0120000 [Salix dunnii]|uniref:Uncharacterized protein n=1 Tax=Salix dunnii TaxID=1413687 RepID=A0A835MXH5_9ROSI|nr:hypothetical protein SADUNF_Sadunf11G0120000 [Salix dunnii]